MSACQPGSQRHLADWNMTWLEPVLCHLSFLVISFDIYQFPAVFRYHSRWFSSDHPKTCSPVLFSTMLKTDKNLNDPNKNAGKRMFMVKIGTASDSAWDFKQGNLTFLDPVLILECYNPNNQVLLCLGLISILFQLLFCWSTDPLCWSHTYFHWNSPL